MQETDEYRLVQLQSWKTLLLSPDCIVSLVVIHDICQLTSSQAEPGPDRPRPYFARPPSCLSSSCYSLA